MKIAVLFYHSVYDDEIRGILDSQHCGRWIEIPVAWADDSGERRFGTHIYPGTDSVVAAFIDDACAASLTDAIREFQKGRQKEHTHLALVTADAFV